MALKKTLTDEKGIITRYHKIQSFETDRSTITVKIRSFVNDTVRQKEQAIEDGNVAAEQHQKELNTLQNEISQLMAQNEDGSKTQEIQAKTAELNQKTLDPDAPTWQPATSLHAQEREVRVPYAEPITLAALYTALAEGTGDLAGATEV